jgi:polysaccharide deacetylase family protein (PEP-CTERM system associated)
MTPKHFLSFHVEEHFHAPAFDSPMRRRHWDQFESRVERNTEKILDLLAERSVRATFFVLGWVAERHGGLVRRIVSEGHEIASHGYAHEPVTAQTTKQFREDVRKTKQILEDLIGEPVSGYRAPGFSITKETDWTLPILVEEGYRYDSSLCSRPDRSRRPSVCYRIDSRSGPLWEIPINCLRMAGLALPTHGFSIRLITYRLLRSVMKLAEGSHQAVVVNLRVWEVDPSQPRMKGRARALFQQYYNLAKLEHRLRMLVRDFQFGPLREAVKLEEIRRAPSLALSAATPSGIHITTTVP